MTIAEMSWKPTPPLLPPRRSFRQGSIANPSTLCDGVRWVFNVDLVLPLDEASAHSDPMATGRGAARQNDEWRAKDLVPLLLRKNQNSGRFHDDSQHGPTVTKRKI